mmetsp:Transcript_53906/g.174129  ORF Transcript_53906/g.174129 Transcript_53906/m.174129 type:complete len:358 (+) Transcript_53906:584-1657(+)
MRVEDGVHGEGPLEAFDVQLDLGELPDELATLQAESDILAHLLHALRDLGRELVLLRGLLQEALELMQPGFDGMLFLHVLGLLPLDVLGHFLLPLRSNLRGLYIGPCRGGRDGWFWRRRHGGLELDCADDLLKLSLQVPGGGRRSGSGLKRCHDKFGAQARPREGLRHPSLSGALGQLALLPRLYPVLLRLLSLLLRLLPLLLRPVPLLLRRRRRLRRGPGRLRGSAIVAVLLRPPPSRLLVVNKPAALQVFVVSTVGLGDLVLTRGCTLRSWHRGPPQRALSVLMVARHLHDAAAEARRHVLLPRHHLHLSGGQALAALQQQPPLLLRRLEAEAGLALARSRPLRRARGSPVGIGL